MKKFWNARLASALSTAPVALAIFASPLQATALSKLESFDFLKLGMPYSSLIDQKAACDQPRDTPNFRESLNQGVSTTVCPTSETFAMATLLEDKVASVAVNWVSWDARALQSASPSLARVPSDLRRQYGIPVTTVPYESQYGNPEADAFCRAEGTTCQMHIWKDNSSERVANLIYAKNAKGEVPLLFNLTDLAAESRIEAIKNRGLQASIISAIKEAEPAH